ncbi:MAG TPA: DUF2997 domain-containing protein [Lentisphaeria bacterium]|nr:DUF2997 domain-containing protein [Lentisphaeria bacterium]
MAAREITITISPDGTVSAAVSGYPGPVCEKVARQLAEILGTEVSFTPTAEYYEPEEQIDLDVNEHNQRLP